MQKKELDAIKIHAINMEKFSVSATINCLFLFSLGSFFCSALLDSNTLTVLCV